MSAQHVNALIGCRLHSKKHSSNSFSLRRRVLSDDLMMKANNAINFNGRHFLINFSLTKDIPSHALALIEEKVRLTNLFIEDLLDANDQNSTILTPCGTIVPLGTNQLQSVCTEYGLQISWYHVCITVHPDIIKNGLRSGWSIAGLLLPRQIFKVACYRSRTNLRSINHNIWFEYDLLNEQVCCHSGVKIEGCTGN